ncbi:MAG: GntR family transcriptional regulator [Pseudomonadota bacterium]|jgi:DNA-binding GntR family transcriptional regulator|uniref:GntR family transcriptional regulator n=1 Tax=unclassified Sphingomonas TaxID=196159 RepID=UPI00053EE055|nr:MULTISPECIES: GntR family transcriptional regulator [unclassified Sphingomonas]
MSPAHVLEPTYEAIKRRLVVGDWPMGFRLEAVRLAGDLGVSITPVRDSLYRLAGERLVDTIPGEGFRVPSLSEQGLREMFDFNLLLLLGAIDADAIPFAMSPDGEMDHATAIASLFLAIASLAGNGEVVAAVESLNDRLHQLRQLDESFLPEALEELDDLRASFSSGQWRSNGRDLLTRYHLARRLGAGRYIRIIAGKGKS